MEGFLKPNEILKKLELRDNMVAADFGSGSGGWVLPLAKILEDGKVYALDILEEPLSVLKSKKVFNVETMLSDVEKGTPLSANACDLVLMTNLLFEVDDKRKVLEEAKRVLQPGGQILIVDWQPDAPLGPKEGRVSAEAIKAIAQGLDLKFKREFSAGLYHYGLILLK